VSRRGCTCKGGIGGHTRFVHFWQRMEARALHFEITYYHGDDEGETKREFELSIPAFIWRPRCWLKGHTDSSYGYCVICRKPGDWYPNRRRSAA
jgi:hypothetical protein